MRNVTVVGLGYVGLSIAVLLSRGHRVTGLDTDAERVKMLQSGVSPIQDKDIEHFESGGDDARPVAAGAPTGQGGQA